MSSLSAVNIFAAFALAASASACWPPQAPANETCNVEGNIKPAYGYYGTGVDFENAYQCWELCTDARRPPRCLSFSWEPSVMECHLFDVSVGDGVDVEDGTGVFFFSKDCFAYTPRPGVNTK